ncbi:MAG: TatD family hydrolase [Candidatus Andersenbacteria bacterium]
MLDSKLLTSTPMPSEGSELIDTHGHLEDEQFDEDRLQVWQAAQAAGVVTCISPGSNVEDSQKAITVAHELDSVFAAVGIHPHYLPKNGPELQQSIETLDKLAADDRVVAIGEFGLDVKHGREELDAQLRAVSLQLELAAKHDLPIILHCRSAYAELAKVVSEEGKGLRGVVHCFAGTPDDLKLMLDLGLHVAYGGMVTFEKGMEALREAVKQTPLERMLLETDAPYLTPVPRRGQRNTPAEVVTVAQFIAELQGISYAELAAATTRNARQLFSLPDATEAKKTNRTTD